MEWVCYNSQTFEILGLGTNWRGAALMALECSNLMPSDLNVETFAQALDEIERANASLSSLVDCWTVDCQQGFMNDVESSILAEHGLI